MENTAAANDERTSVEAKNPCGSGPKGPERNSDQKTHPRCKDGSRTTEVETSDSDLAAILAQGTRYVGTIRGARYLGVSRSTFRRYRKAGLFDSAGCLPGGNERFDLLELDRFLRRTRERQLSASS